MFTSSPLHQTILYFNNPIEEGLENIAKKREKLETNIFSFSQNVFNPFPHTYHHLADNQFLFCNPLELEQVKNCRHLVQRKTTKCIQSVNNWHF